MNPEEHANQARYHARRAEDLWRRMVNDQPGSTFNLQASEEIRTEAALAQAHAAAALLPPGTTTRAEMSEQTRIALKNYIALAESRPDAAIHWDSDTLVYGDGGVVVEMLIEPGFTDATNEYLSSE